MDSGLKNFPEDEGVLGVSHPRARVVPAGSI